MSFRYALTQVKAAVFSRTTGCTIAWLVAMCSLASCSAPAPRRPAQVVLFAGSGTSPNDVTAIASLLRQQRLVYVVATSGQIEAMTDAQLRAHRLIVVPGGNFEEIGKGLTPETATRIREAVGSGLGYLGFCAGAFFAGDSPYNGLNLTSGVRFPFYGLEHRGIRKAAVAISTPDGATIEHYWEDGPELSGWGEILARYPDGTAAVVQGMFGTGVVILTGTHPEAPESWRRELPFTMPGDASRAYAAQLIAAGVRGQRLPHY